MKKKLMRTISFTMVLALIGMNTSAVTAYAQTVSSSSGASEDNAVITEDGTIGYADNVVTDIEAGYETSESADGSIELVTTDETAATDLQEGDILILPAQDENDTERIIEVEEISSTPDGYKIEGSAPEDFLDIVDYVDLEGETAADYSDISTFDGVAATMIETSAMQSKARSFSITSTGNTTMSAIRFDIDKRLNERDYITGSIVIEPSLEYRMLIDFGGIEEMTVKLNNHMELSKLTVNCSEAGSIPIATLPYSFGSGMFSAYVTLYLVYLADGSVYVNYSMDGACGISYDGASTDVICDYVPGTLEYGVNGKFDAGLKLNMGLTAYHTYTLMDAEINTGIRAEIEINDTDTETDYAAMYFYLNGSYGYASVLSQYGVCGKADIYNKENSPVKYEIVF